MKLSLEPLEDRTMPAVTLDALVVPPNAAQGQQVTYDASATSDQTNASLTYDWTFGDGGTASGVGLTDPTYTYAAPSPSGAPYTVSLTVSDGTQNNATASETIAVSDVPPSVDAGTSLTIYAGSAAPFNASVTDAGGPSQIASIQWDFNNDGTTFNADPSADGLTSPSHTYAGAGTYVVAVEATDVSGQTTEDFTTVTVKPTDALLVNAGTDLTTTAGQSVSLSDSYTDPGGTVSSSGIAWDTTFGGSAFTPNVTGTLTPSVTYASAGTYYAALQITDSTGAVDQSVVQVTVNPVSHTGPTADAGNDQTVNPGTNVSFSGSYTDPDGTVSSSGIAWDPNFDRTTFNPVLTGTLTPSYQYNAPGAYTVALQITDSNGLTSLSTLNLTVNSVAPTVSVQGPSFVTAGQTAYFTATATLPSGDMDTLSYAWDFNYDGSNFIPSALSGLSAQPYFATPGTYTVAFQATDGEGDSSLATTTLTVTSTTMLVVNPGGDQLLSEGDTTSFSGAWTDGMGTVSATTAQWDFNFTGSFTADPSANGTLTPSHQFTSPGLYEVALRLTDSNYMTSTGYLYVVVSDVPPTASAGGDQTVNQNSTVYFTGTATEPSGVTGPLNYAWDFDYGDHTTFTAMSTGTLTPTYTYATPGTYQAALQVTDAAGGVGLDTATITVNDVPPTATVTNSGPANVGSPVTFTVSNIQDATPGDTPSYAVNWDGSGSFQPLSSDDLTVHQDGSVTFSNTYDTPSGPSGYNAVVQITDGNGGVTNYTSNVVINAVAPTATFGPSTPAGHNGTIDATVPFVFGASDPSVSDTQAGFTYYVSLDGAAYTSSTSSSYLLPAGINTGQHTVTGYVTDSNGLSSTPVSWTGTVQAAQVTFLNNGTGQVQINWTGSGGAVTLNANQSYSITGTPSNFAVTLLTSGATYQLETNGSIDSITAAAGVSDVSLTVDTGVNYTSAAMWVGDGHIGTVSLPGGGSTVSLYARGDLADLTGSSSAGTQTGLSALDLVFANLTGSITGLDTIASLTASGWLGTSASEEVEAGDGIGSLTAYGFGANVLADARQDAGDRALTVNAGDGGMPDTLSAGNLTTLNNPGGGDIGEVEATYLGASIKELRPMAGVIVKKAQANAIISLAKTQDLIFDNASPITIKGIEGYAFGGPGGSGIGTMTVAKDLTATRGIAVPKIGSLVASGNVTVGGSGIQTRGVITKLDVAGDLTLTGGGVISTSTFTTFRVGGDMTGQIVEKNGDNASTFRVGVDFAGGVDAGLGGIGSIYVVRNFTGGSADYLAKAEGPIGSIFARRDIGEMKGTPAKPAGKIEAASIGTLQSGNDDILLESITTTGGDLGLLKAFDTVQASVTVKGNITEVEVGSLKANLTANKGADGGGGTIGTVSADRMISNDVTIRAYGRITQITVVGAAAGAVEAFNVYAGAPGVEINLGDANFLGSVVFTQTGAYKTYVGAEPLLTLTVKGAKAPLKWSVSGEGNGTIKSNLTFKKLKSGQFGWVKEDMPFTDKKLNVEGDPQGAG